MPTRCLIWFSCARLLAIVLAMATAPLVRAEHVLRVGPSAPIRTISQASGLAQDGDIIEIEPGEYVGDVAVWTQNQLTIRAVRGRVKLTAAGASAEGKAIWVVRGGDIKIQDIDFRGARVPDRNGAGIRLEKGYLVIRNCSFIDNENGILTAGGDATLEIEDSEFAYNGAGDGLSHNIYVGPLQKFKVTGSYFHHARIGHLLKSRARENLVLYNRLTDEAGGQASYELEFPNGGISYVIGNIIEQAATTENPTIISIGSEGYAWPDNALYLASNTIVDDLPASGVFLFVKPGNIKVTAINNLLLGNAQQAVDKDGENYPWMPPGITGNFRNNYIAGRAQFISPAKFDFRLKATSSLRGKFSPPGIANHLNLSPQFEYVYPSGIRALPAKPVAPGALQTPGRD